MNIICKINCSKRDIVRKTTFEAVFFSLFNLKKKRSLRQKKLFVQFWMYCIVQHM